MIPHLVKGRGISGAMAYVMGQGNDAITKERKTLAKGQESRVQIIGGPSGLRRRGAIWNG